MTGDTRMTTSSTATAPRRTIRFGNRQQLQQLLAFGGLVVIFVFFSVASPYFLDSVSYTHLTLPTKA